MVTVTLSWKSPCVNSNFLLSEEDTDRPVLVNAMEITYSTIK